MRPLSLLFAVFTVGCVAPSRDDDSDVAVDSDETDDPTAVDTDDTDVPVDGPRRPFPQHVDYEGALLRPSGAQASLDADVLAAYQRWKGRYLVDAPPRDDGTARVRVRVGTTDDAGTVSEGQGYGAIVLATMAGADPDAQVLFDALWAFSSDHRSTLDERLSDWFVPSDEAPSEVEDDNAAFDGDADLAWALLLADAQWGSEGVVDYLKEARQILRGLESSAIGPDSHLPLLGDWVTPDAGPYDQWATRPSDFMVDHFRAFAVASGEDRWLDVADASLDVAEDLVDEHAPVTGLLPDFAVGDPTDLDPAEEDFLEGEADGRYAYNAGRVPWRLGFDALLTGDVRSRVLASRISGWMEDSTGGDPLAVAAGYELDGTPDPREYPWTTFFVAPVGVAAMTRADQQVWLDEVYASVVDVNEGYYEDSVTLLCLLVMTGNAWAP